jgi:hypothetical protein
MVKPLSICFIASIWSLTVTISSIARFTFLWTDPVVSLYDISIDINDGNDIAHKIWLFKVSLMIE